MGQDPVPARTHQDTHAAQAELDRALVLAALRGEPEPMRRLVDRLTPVIQVRVARALLARVPAGSGRDVRQEVADLTQEVFVALFADAARTLRSWAPERSLSLDNFVGLVAQRQACSVLRTGRSSPFVDDAQEAETLERLAGAVAPPDAQVASREELSFLLDRLRASLSRRGLMLFYRLLVFEEPVRIVRASTGMTADAIYSWRSRVAKLLRRLARELRPETSNRPRKVVP